MSDAHGERLSQPSSAPIADEPETIRSVVSDSFAPLKRVSVPPLIKQHPPLIKEQPPSIKEQPPSIKEQPPLIKEEGAQQQWQVLFERVREILRRDDMKQKALAEQVGMTGSTLSLILQSKYKHTKDKHMHKLEEWVCNRDYQYVENVKHYCVSNGDEVDEMPKRLGITPTEWQSWLNFSLPASERNKIDLAIKRLFGIQHFEDSPQIGYKRWRSRSMQGELMQHGMAMSDGMPAMLPFQIGGSQGNMHYPHMQNAQFPMMNPLLYQLFMTQCQSQGMYMGMGMNNMGMNNMGINNMGMNNMGMNNMGMNNMSMGMAMANVANMANMANMQGLMGMYNMANMVNMARMGNPPGMGNVPVVPVAMHNFPSNYNSPNSTSLTGKATQGKNPNLPDVDDSTSKSAAHTSPLASSGNNPALSMYQPYVNDVYANPAQALHGLRDNLRHSQAAQAALHRPQPKLIQNPLSQQHQLVQAADADPEDDPDRAYLARAADHRRQAVLHYRQHLGDADSEDKTTATSASMLELALPESVCSGGPGMPQNTIFAQPRQMNILQGNMNSFSNTPQYAPTRQRTNFSQPSQLRPYRPLAKKRKTT